jgi:hypothetical protein
MEPVRPAAQILRRLGALLVAFSVIPLAGCDLEVSARADVPLDSSHTLHITYRSAAPSTGQAPSRR